MTDGKTQTQRPRFWGKGKAFGPKGDPQKVEYGSYWGGEPLPKGEDQEKGEGQ